MTQPETLNHINQGELELTVDFLRLVNESCDLRDLIQKAARFFQQHSGCDAVGIRLKEGDDYPYYEWRGFSEEFVLAETHLCLPDGSGDIQRDEAGNPVLACMCGNVIEGRFDPAKPFFSKVGSFWSNCTTDLLDGTTDADRMARSRNRCNVEGYESVALVALHTGAERLGLLQLNDRRKGRFSPEKIALWERLVRALAVALAKFKAQDALRASNQRLELALQASAAGVWDWDIPAGRIRGTSRSLEILGIDAPEPDVAFETWKATLHPDDRAQALARLEQALREKSLMRSEYRILRRGEVRWTSVWGRAHYDDAGRPQRMTGICIDTTKSRQLVESLQASRERYRAIFDNMLNGFAYCRMIFDEQSRPLDFIYLDVNESFYKLTGLTDVVGRRVTEVIPGIKEAHPELFEAYGRVALTGRPEAFELEFKPLGIWLSVAAYRPHAGHFAAIFENITDRKRAEESLRESSRRLEWALCASQAGTWDWDIAGGDIEWSPSLFKIFGLDPQRDKASFDAWEAILHPEDREIARARIAAAIEEKTNLASEYRIRRPDQSEVWILAVGQASYDEAGRPLRMSGICMDITQRKRLEEELARAAAQVQRAHKLESIGVLAGGIAHDFNNLLLGLFGYLERAQSCAADGAYEHVAGALAQAAGFMGRAKDLSRQLLTFSAGGAPVRKTMHLSALLRNAVEFSLSGSNIEADLRIEKDLRPCDADENQLSQVLDNLLRNAKEAMPRGGVVSVTAENVAPGSPLPEPLKAGEYVRIAVADRGEGIPPEHLNQVFDPFFTTKEAGHGLGLSIVHSIVTKHAGCVEVDNRPGQGAVFRLYLPASAGAVEGEPARRPKRDSRGGKILVMDDEPLIVQLVGEMLIGMGYSFKGAADGEEALRLYREALSSQEPFYAVILDLTVRGGMGGQAALAALLELDPNVRAVLASGYANDPIIANPKAFGARGTIAKPFRVKELRAVLDALM